MVSMTLARKRLESILAVLEEGLELESGFLKVDLLLADEKKVRAMNLEHRKIDQSTDVLSFETNGHFKRLGMMGSVVICLPVLKRQAKEHGHSEKAELDLLLSHGVLHLLGMDHERSKKASNEMALAEGELLRALGYKNSGLVERTASPKASKRTRVTKAKPAAIKRKKTKRRKARS